MNLMRTVSQSVDSVSAAEAESHETEAATSLLRLVPAGIEEPSCEGYEEPYARLAHQDDERFLYHVSLDAAYGKLAPLADPSAWADVEARAIAAADASTLRRHLRKLAARERLVLYLHYGISCRPQTMTAIARLLGVSRATAYSIERQALMRLRALWRWRFISA